MTLQPPTPAPDDPRLKGHATDYQASHGGHYPPVQKPVSGTPKEK